MVLTVPRLNHSAIRPLNKNHKICLNYPILLKIKINKINSAINSYNFNLKVEKKVNIHQIFINL